MTRSHEHSLLVRLGQENGKPEIYCLDPWCCYRVNYDPNLTTHRKLFSEDVANLRSEKEK